MLWFLAMVQVVAAAPANSQANEAEKLFRAMEKKITEAKSLKVVCDLDWNQGGAAIKVKGSGEFAVGNKTRFGIEGEVLGKSMKVQLLSDGKEQVVKATPDSGDERKPTPENLNKVLTGVVARAGMLAAAGLVSRDIANFDMDVRVKAADFKLGAKEKVGTREAQAVEYKVEFDGKNEAAVKIWIDLKTLLPLKRHFVNPKTPTDTGTETYTEFVIDPQLDAKVFELPV